MTLLRRWLFICAGLALLAWPTQAQVPFAFTPVQLDLPDVNYGKMVYADVDRDGDLDILGAGNTSTSIPFTPAAYVGLGGDIVPISLFNQDPKQEFEMRALPGGGLWASDAAWTDYNRDGILDLVVIGTTHSAAQYETRLYEGNTRLYRGTASGTFEEVSTLVPDIYGGSIALGDHDADGDEDLFISGLLSPSEPFARLYRNTNGSFIRTNLRFEALSLGEAQWVDVDGDGDLDLVHSGVNGSNVLRTNIYYNDGIGRMTKVEDALPAYVFSASSWADFDNDGDLDVAISGASLDPLALLVPATRIYRNNGTGFEQITNVALPQVFYGSLGWADYDNDGDMDLLVTGATNMTSGREARIFRQENRYFIERIWLPGIAAGSATWGDFDGNAVVDLLLSGSNRSLQPMSRLYRNEIRSANSRPLPPTTLSSEVLGSRVTLAWDAGSDAQTPAEGLMYNLRIGTKPIAGDVMAAYSNPTTGQRYCTGPGNVWQAKSRTLQLPRGTYYWTVQSIDQAYAGSKFAPEGTFEISNSADLGTAAEDEAAFDFALEPGYPNPFLGSTTIDYSLQAFGPVRIDVYNTLGQRVRVLVAAEQAAGRHQVVWGGISDSGNHLAAGVYFVRLTAGGQERMQRMVLMR